ETARTRSPPRAASTARAAAQVVFPTPPLPAKNSNTGSACKDQLFQFVGHVGFDAGDPHAGRGHGERALGAALDLADAGEQVGFDGGELLLADLAELQPHLRLEQLLAEGAVVLRFRFG